MTNPTPKNRTVLVVLTFDARSGTLLAQGAKGAPLVLHTVDQLRELVNDPEQPEHKIEQGGFDGGRFFKGLMRAVEAMGDKPEGGA